MNRSKFNLAPKTIIPAAANLALGGAAAYFAAKSRRERQGRIQAEKAEAHVRHQATHDELTGVLNRRGLEVWLANNRPPRAMLYADGTNIKEVNDAYGHGRGDEAIVATAEVLKKILRPGDVLARTGGDEFQVILDPTPQAASRHPLEKDLRSDRTDTDPNTLLTPVVARVGEETQAFLARPENADLLMKGFDIAVGGAVWQQGMTVDNLRASAETAMYDVKAAQHAANGTTPRH